MMFSLFTFRWWQNRKLEDQKIRKKSHIGNLKLVLTVEPGPDK